MKRNVTLILICLIIGIGTSSLGIIIATSAQHVELSRALQKNTGSAVLPEDLVQLSPIMVPTDGVIEKYLCKLGAVSEMTRQTTNPLDFPTLDPVITISIGEPKQSHFRYHNNQWYVGIGPLTPLVFHAVDTDILVYEVYTAATYGVWEYQSTQIVQDNFWPDINPAWGVITTFVFMDESCWHQLHYWAYTARNGGDPYAPSSYEQIEFLVDAENPATTWSYTTPSYFDPAGHFMWITNQTHKQLVVTDTGCNPQGSGVYTVDWWVTKKINGNWYEITRGIVYDNDINDSDGTPAEPWQGQQGGVWAMDYENRAYTIKDTNRNGSYDSGDTILNLDPDGDGLIAVPHIGDSAGLFAMDRFQEPFTFHDINQDFMYDSGDSIITTNPDADMIPAEPMYGTIGGYYAFDNQSEPYTFQDLNNNWVYDKSQNDAGEPITSLKPDADGVGTIHMSINISQDGEYHIYHQAADHLGNIGPEYKEYVRVDNTAPITVNITGTPRFYYFDEDMQQHVYCITSQTPITLLSTDQIAPCAVGVDFFHYEIWFNNTRVFEKNVTLFDEDTFTMQEECIHELRWYAVDLLGNREPMHNQTYRVDDTPPEILLTQGTPLIPMQNYFWVNKSTCITIDAQNPGCCPFYTVQFRLNRGSWHTITHQLPFNLTFPDECIYELEVIAFDVLNHVDLKVELYYVDDTAPQASIIKPVDGWYTARSPIPAILPAIDKPNQNTPCHDELAVGINPGHTAEAFLLDAFPSFNYVFLNGTACAYDTTQQKFIGNLIIPQAIPFEDGPVLFGTCISDDLGNTNDTLALLYEFFLDSNGNEQVFNQLVQPLLTNHQVAYVGIDKTPPSVTIVKPVCGSMIGPQPVSITAVMQDDLSGINTGTPCHVFLQGILLGVLQYDPGLGGCSGILPIPDNIESGQDIPFTVLVSDTAGNIGQQTILVDVTASHANTPPVGFIISPIPNGVYEGILSVQVQAYDAETATEDLQILVELTRQNDPIFTYPAAYDPYTQYFTKDVNISTYTNGTILQIRAYITDESGYTIITLPVQCMLHSDIVFDQWLAGGWSMVNFPTVGMNNSIPHVFNSILGDFDYIFNANNWDNYRYGRPVNSLTSVQLGVWYWVNMINATRLYLKETG